MASLSRKGGGARPKPAMNVTPLVDVVLVLLIIFMIVIPAMEDSVNLTVPSISHIDDAEESSSMDPFVLSVTRRGTLFFEDIALERDAMEGHLANANAREPQRRIVLRGDRGVEYQHVRGLLAVVQNIGFPGVSLRVTERSTDGKE